MIAAETVACSRRMVQPLGWGTIEIIGPLGSLFIYENIVLRGYYYYTFSKLYIRRVVLTTSLETDQKKERHDNVRNRCVLQPPEARNASPYSGKLARHTHTVWMHKRL